MRPAGGDRLDAGFEHLPLMHQQTAYSGYKGVVFNNAFLLLHVRYNTGLDVFEAVYNLAGRDWSQALSLFSQAAASPEPLGFLQGLLSAPASEPAP